MKSKHKQFIKEMFGNMATIRGVPVPSTYPCAMTKFGNKFEWTKQKKFLFVKVKVKRRV